MMTNSERNNLLSQIIEQRCFGNGKLKENEKTDRYVAMVLGDDETPVFVKSGKVIRGITRCYHIHFISRRNKDSWQIDHMRLQYNGKMVSQDWWLLNKNEAIEWLENHTEEYNEWFDSLEQGEIQ
jgi:hypothetical protein